MTVITNVSRRDYLKGVAAASGPGARLSCRVPQASLRRGRAKRRRSSPMSMSRIDETGLVTIVAHRSEMGTGIKTGLPMVLADELEADWSRVKVVQAQGDPKYGDQNTDGSRSMRQFYQPMRMAGATARQMLETAAAQVWNVDPAGECRAQNQFVVHVPSGRKLAFGDLAKVAATLPVPPADHRCALQAGKDAALCRQAHSDRRSQGHRARQGDLRHRRRGSGHEICLDRALPGLWRQGQILRPEGCAGGTPASSRSSRSRPRRFRRASTHWAASRSSPATPGRRSRAARNSRSTGITVPMPATTATAYRAELEATAKQPGQVVRRPGRCRRRAGVGRASASRPTISCPHYAHAPMEVPNAVAHWVARDLRDLGADPEPDAGAQDRRPGPRHQRDDVTVNVTLLGGGFGRKSKPDYVAEAALLSRKVGAPIKVTWTREDEIQHDYYHAICAQHLEAGLDHDGRADAWLHRTVFPPIEATFQPDVDLWQRRRTAAGRRSTCPMTFQTCAARTAPRQTMSASAGIARSTTSRMPSRCARSPTSSPRRRARTRSNICGSCSGSRASSI